MGKRSSEAVVSSILNLLTNNPGRKFQAQDVVREAGVTWDSAKKNLELYCKLGILTAIPEGNKTYYQIKYKITPSDTLFSLPLSDPDKEIIRILYASIIKLWSTVSDKPLTKTLVQKIAVGVVDKNKQFDKIPRGWYLYGKLLLLSLDMNKPYGDGFTRKIDQEQVISVCKEYAGCCDKTYKIRLHQYKKENNKLYLLKEELQALLSYCNLSLNNNKNKIRQLLNEFAITYQRREFNSKIGAIVEDFTCQVLAILRHLDDNKIEEARPVIIDCFNAVWQLVGTYELFDSLCQYYDKGLLQAHLFDKIETLEECAEEALETLQDYKPSFDFPDEISRKLKGLIGSGKGLGEKERKERIQELDKIRSEKGETGVQDHLSKQFGL